MARPANRLNDAQLPLADSVQAVHRSNGERIRKLLAHAIASNGLSLSELARETNIDNSQITRMLNGEAGLRADFLAAVASRDHLGVFVSGFAGMWGYETKRKEADLAAENRRLRDALTAAVAALEKAVMP